MAQYTQRHGTWFREKDGKLGRPVGRRRSRRLDRKLMAQPDQAPGGPPGEGPSPSGDREPRRPIGPLPTLAAHAEIPT